MDNKVLIGIIGGSGLGEFSGARELRRVNLETPYGKPSDEIVIMEIGGREVAFLSRHGKGHRYSPGRVPYRANIWALKKLGVFWCISVSAVGSLQLEIAPEDFVIPDQIIDRTKRRDDSFFEEVVAHASFAYPFNRELRGIILDSSRDVKDVKVHDGGTYVCMEGPCFSTRAESELYRSWGASLVGMTAIPEAKLAMEAEMAYATIALATDYDCWHESVVSVDEVLGRVKRNTERVREILKILTGRIPVGREHENSAYGCMANAITGSAGERFGMLGNFCRGI